MEADARARIAFFNRPNRLDQYCRRIVLARYQAVMATMFHANIASPSVTNDGVVTTCQTVRAKAAMPVLPNAAPKASRAAASSPRRAPRSCLASFRLRSCFSINVELAQKIAGNAKNRPPHEGPANFVIAPAAIVARPPSTKRIVCSYHRLCLSEESLSRMIVMPAPRSSVDRRRYQTTRSMPQCLTRQRSTACASTTSKPQAHI